MRIFAKIIWTACLVSVMGSASATGWLICQLAPGTNENAVASDYDIEVRDHTKPSPFYLFWIPDSRLPEDLQIQMQFDIRVLWAEDNVDVEMPEHVGGGKGASVGVVNDPFAFFNLNDHALDQVFYAPPTFFGTPTPVRVGVIDTGLSGLERRTWTKRVVASANFVEALRPAFDRPMNTDSSGNGIPDEAVGHGTMVASMIAEMTVNFPLVIVRAADSDGKSSSWLLTKALAFAARNGCRVINLSLGSVGRIAAMSHVLDWTQGQNIAVIAAAGNNGIQTDFYPASYSNAISVCAVDPGDIKAPFSNYEGTVDSAAPGTGILAKFWKLDYAIGSGTSFSTPFVSAGVAIAYAFNPSVTVSELRVAVEVTGDNIDGLNPLYQGKIGTRLNIIRLVEYLRGN